MKDWRSVILEGVQSVVYPGCLPGVLVVFGENSQAILANRKGQVLCAAAEYGKGRILVFSHDMFVNSFIRENENKRQNKQFNENIRKWITRGLDKGGGIPSFVDYMNNFVDLPPECKILAWDGLSFPTEDDIVSLLSWIERGGGLICGVCPWGFVQIHKIDVENMPLNHIFKVIDVAYAGELTYHYDTNVDEIVIRENKAECVKPQDIIASIKKHPERIGKLGGMIQSVFYLPEHLYSLLKPSVVEIVHKIAGEDEFIPSRTCPIDSARGKKAASLYCDIMIRDGLNGKKVVAKGIDEFPGIFPNFPELQCTSLSFVSTGSKYHPTGYYLPPGTVMKVSWTKSEKTWKVFIGLHRDELFSVEGELRRWPKVTIKKDMKSSPIEICSPFGGLVYLESPGDGTDKIEVKLNNVIPAPLFTYKTAIKWESEERQKPGLWCDILGDRIAFTLPTSSVRELSDLTQTMKIWDAVVSAHIELRGKDPSGGRGEWVVTDEQPSAGYMHSGYPIVTHMDLADPKKIYEDCFVLNGDHVKHTYGRKGSWGLFHELGHNFQDELWTWSGTVEVTCNVFTLHAMDVVCDVKPWSHPWLVDQYEKSGNYLQAGAKYDNWCEDPGIALMIYAQLARDFGWKAYKAVFKLYNKLPMDKHPKSNDQKENMWIVTFSRVVKRNLCPAFEFWGWPIRNCVLEEVKTLPPYFPDDESTNSFAPQRATKIFDKYRTVEFSSAKKHQALNVQDATQTDTNKQQYGRRQNKKPLNKPVDLQPTEKSGISCTAL